MAWDHSLSSSTNLFEYRVRAFEAYNRYRSIHLKIQGKEGILSDSFALRSTDISVGLSTFDDVSSASSALSRLDHLREVISADENSVSKILDNQTNWNIFGRVKECLAALRDLDKVCEDARKHIDNQLTQASEGRTQVNAPVMLLPDTDAFTSKKGATYNGGLNERSVDALRSAAKDLLSQAIKSLKELNTDRRFIDAVSALRRRLSASKENFVVEAAGVQYEIVVASVEQFREELPSVTMLQITQALRTTGSLLQEYEDWRAYKIAEGRTEIDHRQAETILEVASQITEDLKELGDPVDPEISERLNEVISPALSGLISSDAVAVPAVLSLANIMGHISNIIMSNSDLMGRLGESAVSVGSKSLNYIAMSGLIVIFSRYGVILENIPGMKFIKSTNDYISRRYPWIKDMIK